MKTKIKVIGWLVAVALLIGGSIWNYHWTEHKKELFWREQHAAERKAKVEAERKGLQYYDAQRLDARERKYDSSVTDSERLAGIEYQLTLLRIDQQEARARRTP